MQAARSLFCFFNLSALLICSQALAQVVREDDGALEPAGPAAAGAKKPTGEIGGFPVVLRTPETGFGGGAALMYIPVPEKAKVSSVLAGFLYTEKNQLLTTVYSEQYFAEDRYAAEVFLSYQDYPDSFFGIGSKTRAEDEESYTWKQQRGAFSLKRLFTPQFRAGIHAIVQSDSFDDYEAGKQLANGTVPGYDGGNTHGIGGSLRWDSLDDGYAPNQGTVANLSGTHYGEAFGSDYAFNSYELNLKGFLPLGADSVLGAQLYGQMNTGEPPFYMLAELGGKNLLRGYFLGRYRDRDMVVAQTEYRRRLIGRFGGVLFAGAGDVAHDPEGLRVDGLKPGAGFGFRYQVMDKQRINIRLDFGFAPHETNPSTYIFILEAF